MPIVSEAVQYRNDAAPVLLRFVERAIRRRRQARAIQAVMREEGDTDTGADGLVRQIRVQRGRQ
ncbi:hypothetical protein [Pseudomonas sp.]|uniref:hypothetical protein n=1 Tax=Pseudomonas sp. TaxID=306 RepID=UPI00258B2414|nr:hypothetical protein [Pseudomonas sp.]